MRRTWFGWGLGIGFVLWSSASSAQSTDEAPVRLNGVPVGMRCSKSIARCVLTATLLILIWADRGVTQQQADSARPFLAASFGLTSADLARLDRGEVVSRTLDASDNREVATLGVARVRMTPEFYADRLGDIANFKKDEAVLQIGTFGDPPELRDVNGLTLEASDVRSLRGCQVGDCDVQLSAEAIDRFRREVNWAGNAARQDANLLMRRILVEYVTRYQASGGTALIRYADRSTRVDVSSEFLSLIASNRGAFRLFPDLRRHLVEYPGPDVGRIKDLIYWSKEKIGRTPVVSVTHLAIARMADGAAVDYAVASKQLYGSHYFDASLGLTVLLRDQRTSLPSTFLVYVNRSRVDAFGGFLGGITRKLVRSRARSTLSEQLARMQERLERQFAAAGLVR